MKKILVFCLLLFGVWSCSPQPSESTSPDDDVHMIVDAPSEGLSIKRSGWTQYTAASIGTTLRSGDQLRLVGNVQARIICSNLNPIWINPGIWPGDGQLGCQRSKGPTIKRYRDIPVNTARGDETDVIPILIEPRSGTQVLTEHPTLRWKPIKGAASYTVTMTTANSAKLWETEVNSASPIVYPNSAPTLVPSTPYIVTVATGTHSSNEEGGINQGFMLMKASDAQRVHQAEVKIRGLGLSDTPTRLLLANLYTGESLHNDAIEQLEPLLATLPPPSVPILLGKLYRTIGVSYLAEARYTTALDLAQQANDLEAQAVAHRALGQVYQDQNKTNYVRPELEVARELYRTLGDETMVKQIDMEISKAPTPKAP